ncbi:MAG TPA: hypothetical protein VHU42_13525 [Rhodopila sp.]|nr:hypothetical protein [Rhodopila sp.]
MAMLAGLPALAGQAAPALAEVADPAPHKPRSAVPADPLALIPFSGDAWSVSRTEAGCYLLSPRAPGGSSLAIGWRSKQEQGLFLSGLALAVPRASPGEPVPIQAAGREITGLGRMVGFKLLFVPLAAADMESILRELRDNGTLWLKVRDTWIAHGGLGSLPAVATYSQTCAAADTTSR